MMFCTKEWAETLAMAGQNPPATWIVHMRDGKSYETTQLGGFSTIDSALHPFEGQTGVGIPVRCSTGSWLHTSFALVDIERLERGQETDAPAR